jgi:hypothetical protein
MNIKQELQDQKDIRAISDDDFNLLNLFYIACKYKSQWNAFVICNWVNNKRHWRPKEELKLLVRSLLSIGKNNGLASL